MFTGGGRILKVHTVLYSLLIALALLPTVSAFEQENLRAVVIEAFKAISEAERDRL